MNEPEKPDRRDNDDLGSLYRAGPHPAPPPEIGAQLRQAARDAVHPPMAGQSWPWRQGVAVAAVAVLSVAIVLLLPREQFDLPTEEKAPAASGSDVSVQPASPVLERLDAPLPPESRKRQALGVERQQASPPAPRLQQAPAEEPASLRSSAESAPSLEGSATGGSAFSEETESVRVPDDKEGDTLEESYYRSSPELWISHIERLLSEGRFTEAKREFDAFQERFPQHPYAAQQ